MVSKQEREIYALKTIEVCCFGSLVFENDGCSAMIHIVYVTVVTVRCQMLLNWLTSWARILGWAVLSVSRPVNQVFMKSQI